jgi:hypothetical protein
MRPVAASVANPCRALQMTSAVSSRYGAPGGSTATNSSKPARSSGGVCSLANFTSVGMTNIA